MSSSLNVRRGLIAISPIIIFLIVYLLTSLIIGDFYKMPLSVAFLISSVWAALTLSGTTIAERIEIFSKGAGSSNVMYMVWIFILAGAFSAVAKHTGAVEATVNFAIGHLPSNLIVPGLFIATCFISMAIGSSVGTVVALTPLAVDMAAGTGSPLPFFVAIVVGGAFFGDNLSFISDTTIAATRSQGCDMKEKFIANFRIVLPAAIIALLLYCLKAPEINTLNINSDHSPWLVIPYLIVIALALIGINVTIVLLTGIISAITAGIIFGESMINLFKVAGDGIASVGDLIVITLLAAGMLGIIKQSGGIEFILKLISRNINSSKGAQMSILSLVGLVNLCTANNTVAIITVGPLAKKISASYQVSSRQTASLLDTGSCIVQALIPYGAQTLMATSIAGISPIEPWPWLFYPQILIVCVLISILLSKRKFRQNK